MHPTGGAAVRLVPENGNAAPTANRDGADHRKNKKPLGSASVSNKYEPRSVSSTGKEPGPTKKRQKQSVDDRFAGETPKQIALHREIDRHYAGRFAWDDLDDPDRPKPTAKQNKRMRDVEAFIAHRNRGRRLSDDDSGRDDLLIAAHHIYHYGDPDRKIRAWAQEWAPWLSEDEVADLIETVCKRPLKWKADTLGRKFRATGEEIAMLGITTFGAFDDSTRKRAKRRQSRKNDRRRARRHAAGATPRTASMARAQPWKAEGISRRTWYRRRKAETSASISEALAPAYSVTVNVSIGGPVAQNGTTLAPTRYSSNCWVPTAKVQVIPQAPVAVDEGLDGTEDTGAACDRSGADGRARARRVPALAQSVIDRATPRKPIPEKKEGDHLCFYREATGNHPGSVDREGQS